MGLLADCRAHYERYLAGIAQAQGALAEGAIGEAAAAVERAGVELAALALLAPGVAALRRSEGESDPARTDELAALSQLIEAGRTAVDAAVSTLRHRQARTLAELTELAGLAGPYAPALAGSVLLDRNA